MKRRAHKAKPYHHVTIYHINIGMLKQKPPATKFNVLFINRSIHIIGNEGGQQCDGNFIRGVRMTCESSKIGMKKNTVDTYVGATM